MYFIATNSILGTDFLAMKSSSSILVVSMKEEYSLLCILSPRTAYLAPICRLFCVVSHETRAADQLYILMKEKPVRGERTLSNFLFGGKLIACLISFGNRSIYFVMVILVRFLGESGSTPKASAIYATYNSTASE